MQVGMYRRLPPFVGCSNPLKGVLHQFVGGYNCLERLFIMHSREGYGDLMSRVQCHGATMSCFLRPYTNLLRQIVYLIVQAQPNIDLFFIRAP